MHLFNSRKKIGFSFLGFFAVTFFVASFAFAAIGSGVGVNHLNENARFGFLSNNPAIYLFGNSSFAPDSLVFPANEFAATGDSTIFEEFDGWVKSFIANGYQADDEQARRGEFLALERREQLKLLIETNPKAALAKALSAETLKQLPTYITDNSEKRVSGTGDFQVYVAEGGNKSRTTRSAAIGESRYKAFVYGRREVMTTKLNIPLQGVVIDDLMAVDESPARLLGQKSLTAEIGGEQVNFSNRAEFDGFVAEQIDWESKIGPTRPKTAAEKGNSAAETLAPEQTAAWTTGTKKLLVIRVDFPDVPGVPLDDGGQQFTTDKAQQLYAEVNDFFVKNSYGKTNILPIVPQEIIRLPQPLTYYVGQHAQNGNLNVIRDDARNAAIAKGYDYRNYDLDVVAFTSTRLANNEAAVSTVGDKGSVLTGSAFYLPEAAHELGHNYGLNHANLWRTTDQTPIGNGQSIEYGDCFDMMGANIGRCSSINQNTHFNAIYKRQLNWLSASDVLTVTVNDTYPIYAQDSATGGSGTIRALKINRADGRNYWVEFRQLIPGDAANGALIRWETDGQSAKSQLLDMNPATSNVSDAPLSISGTSFLDDAYGIRITAVSKTNEILNVKVELNLPPANCTYSLSPKSVYITGFSAIMTSTNIATTTSQNCPWTATSNANWLTVSGGASGTGNGTISITAASNASAERTGTVTIGGQTFTVTQASGRCVDSINPSSFNIPASGGNLSYTFGGCESVTPTIEGTSDWININTNPVSVSPNTGAARNGFLRLEVKDSNGQDTEKIISIQQAGQGPVCTYPLNPTNQSFNASGGTGFFTIRSSTGGCLTTYNAVSNNSWITISNPSGQSNDNINYTVAPNTVSTSRTGTVTISSPATGNQTFTVTQAAAAVVCTFSINPASRNFTSAAGTGSFALNASDSSCAWSAATSASWINVTGSASGTGSATINFSVFANNASARTGNITVGGQTFSVSQDSGCVYVLQPSSSAVLSASGASGSFALQTGAGCAWTATSNDSWITVTSNASGSGNGTVGYTVAANTNTAARTGTIIAGGLTFTVNQAAASCTFSINPLTQSFGNGGGNGTVSIASGAGCGWTASSNSTWITVTGGANGSGTGTVNFSIAANTGIARNGTITIAGQTFTVNQADGCAFALSSSNQNFGENGGSGSVNINSGAGCAWNAASNSFWITVTGGANGTGSGTISFSVAANTGATRTGTIIIGNQTLTVTQAAVTVVPNVSISSVQLNEGNSGTTPFVFNVNLSSAANQTISVNFATANGTAFAGEDYSAASGTLTFQAGETSKTIAVSVNGDSQIESNETFSVNLSNAVNATISGGAATGTILNDDAGGSLQFSLSNYTVNENGGAATVTVTRTGGAASGVSVNYSTASGTATNNQDYTNASGTLTFGAGETTKTFAVSITNDSINEPNETINLTLSSAVGGTLGTPVTAVLTILDDDGAPTLAINNVSANEGSSGTTAFNFTVSLLGATSQTVTVNYSTANGTATAPTDYQAASSSVSFAPNETSKTVTILVNGNVRLESNKTFTVNLSNAVNATIANGQGIGTILNDDVPDTIPCPYSISPPNINLSAEGSSGNTFSVSTQGSSGCYSITATTTSSFITINSVTGNAGSNGVVSFSVTANTGAARTGTISINGLATVTVNQAAATVTAPRKVLFDFDGDGKSDVSVFRPDNGVWYQLNSTAGFSAAQFGIPTDKIAPADFDGDGKTDFAVFRDGNWFLQRSRDGFASIQFGSPGDVPDPADFDGDGKAELVVFRPSNGVWYSFNLVGNAFSAVQFGTAEDKPVAADYDGDGKADQAIYRPSSGTWYMLKSRDGFGAVQFGITTDKPVVGDYDGDGRADQAVYRSSNGTWYIFKSRDGFAAFQFGIATDIPAPGDYDGDGKTDVAVFRPASGDWYQMKSTQGFGSVQFGSNGDKPIPNSLNR